MSKLCWKERCGIFKVFISPFRIVEIMKKNPVMELVECNDMNNENNIE
jgi:hypothetical protein